VLATACSHQHPLAQDASADASADSASDSAGGPTGPVTLTVYGLWTNAGQLLADTDVYFVGPDQSVQHVTTGVDGVATAAVQAGTTAFVARQPVAGTWELSAYLALTPGDQITSGMVVPYSRSQTNLGHITFSLPTTTGANAYEVYVSCMTHTTKVSDTVLDLTIGDCEQKTAANVVAVAANFANATVDAVAYAASTNVDLTALLGTTVTIPSYDQAATTLSATFTDSSEGTTQLGFWAKTRRGSDVQYYGNLQPLPLAFSGTSLTFTGPIVPFGDQTIFMADLKGPYGDAYYNDLTASLTTDFTIDVTTMGHPMLAPQLDSSTQTWSWTESPIGNDPNMMRGDVYWLSGSNYVRYEFFMPHATSIAIPALPADLASLEYQPQTTVTWNDFKTYAVIGKTYHEALSGMRVVQGPSPAGFEGGAYWEQ
jgi:hypothetical protein